MYDSVEVGANLVEVSFRDVIRKGSEKKEVQRLTWWQRKQNCREWAETVEQKNKGKLSIAERHVEQDGNPYPSQKTC